MVVCWTCSSRSSHHLLTKMLHKTSWFHKYTSIQWPNNVLIRLSFVLLCQKNKRVVSYKQHQFCSEATPPNVSQARPIEEFWSFLRSKKEMGKRADHVDWEPQNEEQLICRVFQKIPKVDIAIVQRLMGQVRNELIFDPSCKCYVQLN